MEKSQLGNLTMRKTLFYFALAVTSGAIATSTYLATLENPTDTQKHLSATTNAIAVAGTTAIFGLLDDDNPEDNNSG